MTMAELVVNNLCVTLDDHAVVSEVSFSVASGELVALLGANGAGKSTLIRASLGLQSATAGSAFINGENAHLLNAQARAKQLAYLPQVRPLAWPNRVRDVVALGRFAFGAAPGTLTGDDALAVDNAIEACNLSSLSQRPTDTLSGGELARVHCARAFASQTPLIVADEPTAALDPRHQLMIMQLFQSFVANGGGALAVLHDVALAVRYATKLLWMKDGIIVSAGTPEDTLTPEMLAEVYGVDATVNGLDVQLLSAL